MNFNIDATHLDFIRRFTGKGDIRYYLNGIYVAPHPEGGAVLVATDGHILAIVRDFDGTPPETPVILNVSKHLAVAGKKVLTRKEINPGGENLPRLHMSGGRLCVAVMGREDGEWVTRTERAVQPGDPLIEGTYPEFMRVIPEKKDLKPGLAGWFNPELLARMDYSSPGTRHKSVTFYSVSDKNSAVAHLVATGLDAMIVVMPMTPSQEIQATPDWVEALRPPKKQEQGNKAA